MPAFAGMTTIPMEALGGGMRFSGPFTAEQTHSSPISCTPPGIIRRGKPPALPEDAKRFDLYGGSVEEVAGDEFPPLQGEGEGGDGVFSHPTSTPSPSRPPP